MPDGRTLERRETLDGQISCNWRYRRDAFATPEEWTEPLADQGWTIVVTPCVRAEADRQAASIQAGLKWLGIGCAAAVVYFLLKFLLPLVVFAPILLFTSLIKARRPNTGCYRSRSR